MSGPTLRLYVVIATLGRSEIVRRTVAQLKRQTRAPDGIVVACVSEDDVAGLHAAAPATHIIFSAKGSCRQRNHAIDHLRGTADIIFFMDDDFVPADIYLAELANLFASRPDVVGATGRIIADGIKTQGFTFDDAVARVAADVPPVAPVTSPIEALYGCNMAIRLAAADGLRFDEALPLYGWLEDIDFTYRLGQHGTLVSSERLAGVHMGTKRGRTSGLRFGYSQIANPVHLLRKGSTPRDLAFTMMRRNLTANLVRSVWAEPWVDRIGRLRGNMLALRDLALGRLDPRNILKLD